MKIIALSDLHNAISYLEPFAEKLAAVPARFGKGNMGMPRLLSGKCVVWK
jgi:hypothetical protein